MYRLAHSLVSLRAFLHAQQVAHHCSHALAPWRRPSFEQRGQRRLHQAGCFSGQAPAGAPHATAAPQAAAPLPPLSERPAVHTAQLDSLLAWRERALAAISRVGDSWAQLDDGPSQADLETELNWLLDDAVAGLLAAEAGGAAAAARSVTWRSLERGLRAREQQEAGQLVQLRAPLEALEALWRRRLEERAPLQYLTSATYWRDMVLAVGPGILIPRPETEQMVDFVAEAVAASPALGEGHWADLGTGSGALGIGLARLLPAALQVWAVDLNPTAVAYATFNAQRMGVGPRVSVLHGSWFEPLQAAGVGRLAGLVSNPPYVTSQQMLSLQAEVGRHEPHLALDGGGGLGLDALVPICTGAVSWLQPGGFLALETGGGEQAHYVAGLLRRLRDVAAGQEEAVGSMGGDGSEAGAEGPLAFGDVRVRADFFGVERFITATRAGPDGC